LFHFDSNYRPVPLIINFVGIKNPKDANNNISKKRNVRDIYNEKCYEMTLNYLKADKQVLIFVHSRRETVKYCEYMIERAKDLKDDHIMRHMAGILKNYPGLRDQKLKKVVQ
jgi:activating signal cointegrator complex subunit 3